MGAAPGKRFASVSPPSRNFSSAASVTLPAFSELNMAARTVTEAVPRTRPFSERKLPATISREVRTMFRWSHCFDGDFSFSVIVIKILPGPSRRPLACEAFTRGVGLDIFASPHLAATRDPSADQTLSLHLFSVSPPRQLVGMAPEHLSDLLSVEEGRVLARSGGSAGLTITICGLRGGGAEGIRGASAARSSISINDQRGT